MAATDILEVFDEEAGLSFAVSPTFGGEFASLRVRRANRWVELLHRANRFDRPRAGWRGRAPWLFPAVGRSIRAGRPGSYALGGRVYPMPIHGFVKDRAWELSSVDKRSVVCVAASDAETRKMYPYDFELTVVYSLLPDGFSARAEVVSAPSNPGSMPFSFGNHLTLAIPFGPGGDGGACIVRSPASKELFLSDKGLLTGGSAPSPCRSGRVLRDDPRLCDMVLGGFPAGECWAELSDPASFGVRVRQSVLGDAGHARFVFYSDGGRTFFCPEPWYGDPNSLNGGSSLVRLAPGERFDWEMEITVV
ncbi:MAG: hypothetical protein A2506_08860 [Elusimicrobia bacterium RIFOXYD12_FULL_66_9]|nr:MAG: hypothetical protein A2506_08860 [Elusimicrobia bacterium RIFOXYD12_FULL_66_9]